MPRKYASQDFQWNRRHSMGDEAAGKLVRGHEAKATSDCLRAAGDASDAKEKFLPTAGTNDGENEEARAAEREPQATDRVASAESSSHSVIPQTPESAARGRQNHAKALARAERMAKPAGAERKAATPGDSKNGGRAERRAERKRPNAELLENLLEGIEEGVAHISTEGLVLYANAKFAELLSWRPGQMVEGQSLLKDFLSPTCWNVLETGLRQAAQWPTEGSLQVEDSEQGSVRSVRLLLTPVRWKKTTTIKITATEMTELLEKNRELQDKEASLHALSARIMQLQDEERRRIARDLHDITGQELAVVIMQMMEVMRYQQSQMAKEKITDVTELVRKIEEEIRTLSYVLHPPLLDEFGIGSALNWYAEGFTKRSNIQVDVECAKDLPRLPAEKEMALFRVVQEGLTNVMRHSGSQKARIVVEYDAEYVVLSVEDEGRGIDRQRAARITNAMESGVGIAGMRERMQQFGGKLEIYPRAKGTELRATVPIEERAPIETMPTEMDILRMAEALGYKREAGGGQTGGMEKAAQLSGKKRILLVDDHEVTRQGIRMLLQHLDVEICGEAQDGMEAVTKARELDPDLVIMDLSMPNLGGFSAAYRIRQSGSRTKILFFTTHTNREMERMSRMGGFEGLVQKADGARDLVRGVRAILDGDTFYGGTVVESEAKGKAKGKAKAKAATAEGQELGK